jgi:hypothetical protein
MMNGFCLRSVAHRKRVTNSLPEIIEEIKLWSRFLEDVAKNNAIA